MAGFDPPQGKIVRTLLELNHSGGEQIMTAHGVPKNHTSPPPSADGSPGAVAPVKRAYGYVRVSTDMQALSGLSLEAQESQIRGYAQAYGYDIIGFYVDQDSAKSVAGRPEYQKMMLEVDKGKVQLIISTALDRFSRSQRNFLAFQDDYIKTNRVHLCLIREGINTQLAMSMHFMPLIVAYAQMEMDRTSERVKGVIGFIRSQGGHFGKVPFGYTTKIEGKIKKLVKYPDNYAWIERMAKWYKSGIMFEEIATKLNANGVKPSQSAKWTYTSVYDLLIKENIHTARSSIGGKVYDKEKAYSLANGLRIEGKSFAFIADKLNDAGLRPGKASAYKWWSVQELLRSVTYHDRSTAIGCAKYFKAQGYSLRDIAKKLQENGHSTKRGGQWFAQQVKQLLVS